MVLDGHAVPKDGKDIMLRPRRARREMDPRWNEESLMVAEMARILSQGKNLCNCETT